MVMVTPGPNLPLHEENIKKGTPIFYIPDGVKGRGRSCPAVIIRVNLHTRTFVVRPLHDDMKMIELQYTFDVDEHSPGSRKSMVTTSVDVVKYFFSQQEGALKNDITAAQEEIVFAQERLEIAKKDLQRFRKDKKYLLSLK